MPSIDTPSPRRPRVLVAASELAPFAKTGGLGDVLAALPPALARAGAEVHVVIPAYQGIDWRAAGITREWSVALDTPAGRRDLGVRTGRLGDVTVSFAVAGEYFDRPHLYGGPNGDYPDNAERFAFFSRAVLAIAAASDPVPDLLHCHDWHTALVPALLRIDRDPRLARTKTVLTVHNLGYQGLFPPEVWPLLGLDWSWFTPQHFEFYGQVNFLKAGLVFADALTTVSPTYAQEILDPEHGHGLDGVLRTRRDVLVGILNGVDYTRWDPRHDRFLAASYGPDDLSGKPRCKAALQAELGLPDRPAVPVIGMVSRLADQKGFDLVTAALPALLGLDLQLAIVASGDARYERALTSEQRRAPDRLAVRIAFDEGLAHRVEGGADAFLMPSRYEPCGLNQMYSLRYGTVPIVRATGGLDDTVVDVETANGPGTGFKFRPYTAGAMLETIRRALALYAQPGAWLQLMRAGMQCDFSWRRSADHYLDLYAHLLRGAG
jgi:starch synthase